MGWRLGGEGKEERVETRGNCVDGVVRLGDFVPPNAVSNRK